MTKATLMQEPWETEVDKISKQYQGTSWINYASLNSSYTVFSIFKTWRKPKRHSRENPFHNIQFEEDSWVPWTTRRSNQTVLKEINLEYWKDWCWRWSSNTLIIWFEELTYWKRPWCWEGLRAGEVGDRGWDGWMAWLTQWTWFWANSGR